MAGGKKHRGQHHQVGTTTQNNRPIEGSNRQDTPPSTQNQHYLDLNKVLQEVDDRYQVTWREVVYCVLGICILIVLSVVMGIAAGMTISIHYYDDLSPVAVRRMDPRETSTMYSGSAAYRKVTTLDPNIASSNVLQRNDRDGLDLGKVITTSPSGQLNILMVVDEVTPLHVDHGTSMKSKMDSSDSSPPSWSTANEMQGLKGNTKHIPMTMQQANLLVPGYSKWKQNQPDITIREPMIRPKQCSDGHTVGFDDWYTLKAAVQEANSISAERFMKWSAYFAKVGKSFTAFDDDRLYYEQDVIFTICPSAILRARRGPIYINAENVVIQCDQCTIDVGGTHLNFGPQAKNVLIRGVTFKNAHSSSLTLFHDGAEASFEDCFWVGNSGLNGQFGGVADVNATIILNFYRCEVSQGNKVSALGNVHPGATSSLSIRS